MPRLRRPLWRLGAAITLAMAAGVFALTPAAAAHPGPHAAEPTDFQQVTLARGVDEMGEPMGLAVLPDRSVLHTSRDGTVRLTDAAGNTKVAGKIPVYSHDEEGLQSIQVDAGFAANRWVYLFYAPPLSTPAGDAPRDGSGPGAFDVWKGHNQLSRFKLAGDGTLTLSSEQKILQVPADRGICCHVGGDIEFDAQGNLYLSTGDDTNPFESDGYTPIDERTTRNPAFDAQRSSANSADLRGKVLRIKVNADGSYAIPQGNMFPPGTAGTRPEVYAMGFRNPFRMAVDKASGVVYLGDYGPDAGGASARGPGGQVEFTRITAPGFFGWPYCTGDNAVAETYADHNFATGATGAAFDCQNGPANNSPRNTGQQSLPKPVAAWIDYDGCSVPQFCTTSYGGESPMGGPVYHYDDALDSDVKFPAELDQHVFIGEYGRRWIKHVEVGAGGAAGAIHDFPWAGTQVMDMTFGPEGALYVLDYGTGGFTGDANSALYRIEYVGGSNRSPTANASGVPTSGQAPLTVTFSAAGSADPEGDALTYAWRFGDGGTSTQAAPTHTYTANGTYTATLTVTDPDGATGSDNVTVTVGNTAPTVRLDLPADGRLFGFGDAVPYRVTVTDPEDGQIDCSKVKVTYLLGHDSHQHKLAEATGCSGTLQTPVDGEHDPNANIHGVFAADYTDAGGLNGHVEHIAQPKTRQAEHFGRQSGVDVIDKGAAHGAKTVGNVHAGDWIAFKPYALGDATTFTARVSSGGVGGTLQVRSGSQAGPVLGSVAVPVTGGWETFTNVSTALTNRPSGTTELFLVFTGGSGALFDVDDFTFATGAAAGQITGVNGQCVDVAGAGTADGTKIQLYGCNGTGAQRWSLPGDGTVRALGKCMDVKGGAVNDGAWVQLWSCNGTGAQQWQPQANGSLRNPQSGKCLDAEGAGTGNGTRLIIWTCQGSVNQKWTLPA
ncbi:carbohydrate-binding protein [Streptosporangium soli]|nr:PQQ-dependent sugar dehydrogenase [Streptosporangium sp. KLBMP 9127]